MSAENDNDKIFPILDRDTPIIDRLRQRREQMRNSGSAGGIGEQIARAALTGEDVNEDFLNSLRADIANELDIPEDRISGMYISQLRTVFSPNLEELVIRQQTTQEEVTETENQQSTNQDTSESEETNETESVENEEESDDSSPAFPTDDMGEESDDDDDTEQLM